MTRRDRVRADAGSFSAVRRDAQPSAWAIGLQWGGGISVMALALALGFTTLRPTPRGGGRRREEVTPAPVWVRRK
jgi:hypothetical protein